ncbi:hypothetical protein SERLADRAFT_404641 [Serpula lacrymans var. lacrymans S7.9]|uniref:Myb/SANT-like domain-containing protein n=1 Tax=Serpula lacrymans var. lacrymans (strain S7.9) TaxID=578457 RepID=F8NEB7_SERL9|nr:uncharacterized protein SERLADRAFT_404641 [Serpula lacrymans var. lacrymans S7.9]EGO30499.1 hypothetical protein SERLADRAFT_404641 [Serpula lacrymans var. lacrymans S7.9]
MPPSDKIATSKKPAVPGKQRAIPRPKCVWMNKDKKVLVKLALAKRGEELEKTKTRGRAKDVEAVRSKWNALKSEFHDVNCLVQHCSGLGYNPDKAHNMNDANRSVWTAIIESCPNKKKAYKHFMNEGWPWYDDMLMIMTGVLKEAVTATGKAGDVLDLAEDAVGGEDVMEVNVNEDVNEDETNEDKIVEVSIRTLGSCFCLSDVFVIGTLLQDCALIQRNRYQQSQRSATSQDTFNNRLLASLESIGTSAGALPAPSARNIAIKTIGELEGHLGNEQQVALINLLCDNERMMNNYLAIVETGWENLLKIWVDKRLAQLAAYPSSYTANN